MQRGLYNNATMTSRISGQLQGGADSMALWSGIVEVDGATIACWKRRDSMEDGSPRQIGCKRR